MSATTSGPRAPRSASAAWPLRRDCNPPIRQHQPGGICGCRTVGWMTAIEGRARPGSPGSLRMANRRLVIETVYNLGPLTQTEIARATGLSAATVSNLARELGESGVLVAVGASPRKSRGRLLTVASPAGYALGIDVGHRHLRVVLADWTLASRAERRVNSPHGQTASETLARAA